MSSCSPRRGFTLFQLLIVLALLALLLALLLPAVQKVRQDAGRKQCTNNLKQQALAIIDAADINDGELAPAVGYYPQPKPDAKICGTGTLFFHILPFMEREPLYKKSLDGKLYSPWHNDVYATVIKEFVCPDDKSGSADHRYDGWLATSSYAANFLVFGNADGPERMAGKHRYPASILDGLSQTIFLTERYQVCNGEPNAWAYAADSLWTPVFAQDDHVRFQVTPSAKECNPSMPQSPHEGGINVAMGDASVRFVSPKLSAQTWWAACTPDGNDVVGSDW
jgi:type II secretory pathway pseudopilin PulG